MSYENHNPNHPGGQILEFLTITSLPHRGVLDNNDLDTRRIVRSHAIRDANRRKRLKAAPTESQPKPKPRKTTSTTDKPPPAASLMTKFKINQKPPKQTRKKTGLLSEEELRNCRLTQIAHRYSPPPSPSLSPLELGMGFELGAGRWDPFDTLAVKVGPRQQALLDYQQAHLKHSAFTIGSKDSLFSLAAADPAWMNAFLCLISLHHDLQSRKGISRECLMHRAEALRIVNQRLIDAPRQISESTIGAIAFLANFDTTNGLFASATMHVHGLVEIICNRGSLTTEGLLPLENIFLQKIVAWADLSYCTTWDLSPNLPLITTGACRSSIAEFVYFFKEFFPPDTNVESTHDLVGEMSYIFQTMRLLSLRTHTLPSEVAERGMFDRGLYISEYKLLIVLDYACEDADDDEIVVPNRSSHIYGSCRLAAYLYLYIVLRELPVSAVIVQTVVQRLKGILERASADLLILWKADQHLFLWILYMGAVAAVEDGEREFFVGVLRRLVGRMGVGTREAFGGALREVLWEGTFCERESTTGKVWRELMRG